MSFQYYRIVKNILDDVITQEEKNIKEAITLLVDTIKGKRQVFAFGASHAGIVTEELFYRAGGLAIINPIFDAPLMLNTRPVTQTSKMERLEGYGIIIGEKTPFKKGDLLLVHSVSGRNPVALDLVLYAKSKGVKIISITNLKYSKSVTSRHTSKKRLFELSDIVIDNHGDIGDACVHVEGINQKVAATSTVVATTIVNIIISEAAIKLAEEGITPPIFHSANLDGGDQHNKEIFKHYKKIIHYM
ncbi:MAG: SIS domain-containing protein [Candidatus Izemoplasmataceae bacterium]